MSSSISNIGFYSLTDDRAEKPHANLERCEMIVTSFCNFRCPYCRGVGAYSRDCGGNLDPEIAFCTLSSWIEHNVKNVRFSGGEPTLYPQINNLVKVAKHGGIKRIAISSNGSMQKDKYLELFENGVNDFSISLDACCAEDADKMAGRAGYFSSVISNIKYLSTLTYVTVGIVLTRETESTVGDVVRFAHDLGVSDIRIITAAQYNGALTCLENIPADILNAHPILNYRVGNILSGRNVRGIKSADSNRCYLVNDDMAVAGNWHFPCIIHMREGGEPIGKIGNGMYSERKSWSVNHDTHSDPICATNCLDCLVDFNNSAKHFRVEKWRS